MIELMLQGRGVPSAATYDAFITAVASMTALTEGTSPQSTVGYRKSQLSTATGTMWGSPWLSVATYDSTSHRIIQHAFPDLASYTENVRSKRTVAVKYQFDTVTNHEDGFKSQVRNGYTSVAYGRFNASYVRDFIYYDASIGKMMRLDPSRESTPVVWDGLFR